MRIRQHDIWLANLDPALGTEPGKTRPVVIVQTNLLNDHHASTLICPVTTNVIADSAILRIHLKRNQLDRLSDVLVDQVRAIDNERLINKIGMLTKEQQKLLKANLKIVLDL